MSTQRTAARLLAALAAALLLVALGASGAGATGGGADPCRVTEYEFSAAEPGGTASVSFTVPEGCEEVELTLAAYEGTAPHFTPDQVLADVDGGLFAAGQSGTLSVRVPDCFYQVDFVVGPAIEDFEQEGTYHAAGRMIAYRNGGSEPCEEAPPSEPEPAEPTPETVTASPTQPEETAPETVTVTPTQPEETTPETVTPTPPPEEEEEEETGVGGTAPVPTAAPVAVGAQARPTEALASTGAPILLLAGLAIAGLGSGTVLLLRTRRRGTDT